MDKAIILILFLFNVFYIASYLIGFASYSLNGLWLVVFVAGIILSIYYLIRIKWYEYLSIAVLVSSISSLGAFVFTYFLYNMMG
jgi:hypothetical protein